jgi:hypothetical protein
MEYLKQKHKKNLFTTINYNNELCQLVMKHNVLHNDIIVK